MKEIIFWDAISYIKESWPGLLGKLLLGIIIFFILYIIIKYIVNNVKKRIKGNELVEDTYSKRNSELVWSILFIMLMIFNVLATFEIIWFDVAIIMWWISLSLWFAMETTIWNLISGVFILTNKKIKLGDYIEFLWWLKLKWTIEEVNVRYTVIRGFDKKRTIIPNSIVAKTPIRTAKTEPLLKWEIVFNIPRETPFDLIKKIFSQIISEEEAIMYPEHSSIMIENFNKSGISIKWFFFSDPKKKMPFIIARNIKWKLFNQLQKYWIHIPYKHIIISTEKEKTP